MDDLTGKLLTTEFASDISANGLLVLINSLETNQSPGWVNLGKNRETEGLDIQGLIMDTVAKLVALEIRYPDLNEREDDNLLNHIIGNPTRLLIQWMQFYLLGLEKADGMISTDKLVIACSETCVLDFIEKNQGKILGLDLSLEETIIDINNGPGTCSRYLYLSPPEEPKYFESATTVYVEYNNIFKEFTQFLSKYPLLFEIAPDTYTNPTSIALQDRPILSKLKELGGDINTIEWDEQMEKDLANSFVFSFFLILQEEDFRDLYDERILKYWGDRFWVQDATISRSLVITPQGLKNLSGDPKKLRSNALHEYFHFYLNRYFSSESDPMGSSQYILPKWLVEGLCNVMFLTERGRSDDGFREAQLQKLMSGEEKLLTAQEIMDHDNADYLHYSVFTHFLFKVLNSAIDGEAGISPIPTQSYEITNKVLKAMKKAYGKLEIIYPSPPPDLHNFVAIMIIHKILKDSANFSQYDIHSLITTFNNHREVFYADYFFPEWETNVDMDTAIKIFFQKLKSYKEIQT